MNEFEKLIAQREYYNERMWEVLDGNLHLRKGNTRVSNPLSEEQKKKDLFLFKYYEFQYNRLDKLINNSILWK